MNTKLKLRLVQACAAGALALGASPAFAQPPADDTGLGEIVVTAQRRAENLQETPLSVTVFNEQKLEERGIINLQEVGNFTPNLELHQTNRPAGGGSAFAGYIRGVGTGDFQFPTDPGIGVYVDDVYLARSVGGLMSTEDVARIEVLKGPQGTLFGRNTIGGALNIVTTRPKTTGREGYAKIRVGDYGRMDLSAGVNGALIEDRLGGKATIATLNSDGWSRSLQTGRRGNDEDRILFKGALLFRASDKLDLTLNTDFARQRNNGPLGQLIAVNSTLPALLNTFNGTAAASENARLGVINPPGQATTARYDNRWVSPDPYTNWAGQPTYDNYNVGGVSLVANYAINDDMTFKSITAYRNTRAAIGVDGDQTPYSLQTSQTNLFDDQRSQEFQLFGKSGNVDYLVGLFALNEDGHSELYTESTHGLYQVAPGAAPVINAQGVATSNGNARDTRTFFTSKTQSRAVFGQATWHVTDTLNLTVGARANTDDKDYSFRVIYTENGNTQVPLSVAGRKWDSFTPKVGIDWKPTEEIMLYANYSEGFKSGGWGSSNNFSSPTPEYQPETIDSYEAGVKSQWFNNRLTANFALFQSKWEQIQVTVQTLAANGTNLRTTANGGDAEINGWELELNARPIPALTLSAGVGHIDSKFTRVTPQLSASVTPFVVLGTPLPQVPEWSANGHAAYSFETGLGRLTLGGGVAYKGDHFLTLGDATSFQKAYTLYDANIAFVPAHLPNLEFSVNGTNLSDEVYYAYHATLAPTVSEVALPVQPRLIYATLKARF